MLVFSGLPSGSYLHSMRPDGTDLSSFDIPKACSPRGFVNKGQVLVCVDVSDEGDLEKFAVEREGSAWRRVPLPDELRVPGWLNVSQEPWDDRVQWAPAGDRIAFVRPRERDYWFSPGGEVVVADADGSNERVVAEEAEVPRWSPDGKRLAFARCRVDDGDWRTNPFSRPTAECSLWIVQVDGKGSPRLLVQDTDSPPVWSPDGRFVAFIRQSDSCETYCRARLNVVGVEERDAHAVGPELIEARVEHGRLSFWDGLAWLPETAPHAADEADGDQIELQRCVDIWNRARMHPYPTGAINVSIVHDRCQVTVSDYEAVCSQSAEMPFRFWCPSHGAGVHRLPPDDLVWNAHGGKDGRISLFDEPKEPRLPLPKGPPHPLLDGWVLPYGEDGEPLAGLKLTTVVGYCEVETAVPGYPLDYPDRYPLQCYWNDSDGRADCFTPRAGVAIADTVLCPAATWDQAYDPMAFFAVKVTDVY